MKTVCAWCGKLLNDDGEGSLTSHGICDFCKRNMLEGIVQENNDLKKDVAQKLQSIVITYRDFESGEEDYSELQYFKDFRELQDYLDEEASCGDLVRSVTINPEEVERRVRCNNCGKILRDGVIPSEWGLCPRCARLEK